MLQLGDFILLFWVLLLLALLFHDYFYPTSPLNEDQIRIDYSDN
jgi:hypothetical protein